MASNSDLLFQRAVLTQLAVISLTLRQIKDALTRKDA